MKIFKTESEKHQDRLRIAAENTVLWLVRWSQIFFWVGAVLLIVEMIVMINNTFFETQLFKE